MNRTGRRSWLPVEREGLDPAIDLGEQPPGFGTSESAEFCLQRITRDVLREPGDGWEYV